MNAVITGATKGMGKAIAEKLAQAGYNLIICARSQEETDRFCQQLMNGNPAIKAIGLQTDCSIPAQVSQFCSFVQQHFQTVDVLINNVGTFIPAPILDEDDDILHSQLQINFLAAYSFCKFFGRKMRDAQKGHIINICSIAALQPVAAAGAYTVTKAALLSLTKVLRLNLMKHKVKVTAIHPGSTLTSSWEGTSIPSERFVAVEDVANAVLYCLSTTVGANPEELVITPTEGNI
jgi:short-subunit dehydrogenase